MATLRVSNGKNAFNAIKELLSCLIYDNIHVDSPFFQLQSVAKRLRNAHKNNMNKQNPRPKSFHLLVYGL